jgi:hypothetical protein
MTRTTRRYNRFWTEEDDHLLLELRAAGRSSVFIGAALKRSAHAVDKRSSTLKVLAQLAEAVAVNQAIKTGAQHRVRTLYSNAGYCGP